MLYKEITDWKTYSDICAKRFKKAGIEFSMYEDVVKECYDLYIGHIDTINICISKEQTRLWKFLNSLNEKQD